MAALFKIEYKAQGRFGRSRLENVSRSDMKKIVIDTFVYHGGRLPSKVWRRVDNQWRLLSLAAFAAEFD